MRMAASWSGSKRTYRIQILCSGAANSGKSTSPTTEPRERPMHHATTLPIPERTCSPGDCAALFVSLELSRSTWVATALAPGSRKMSKHTLVGGDGRKLLDLLARLTTRAEQRIAAPVKVVTIQEVGLDFDDRVARLVKMLGGVAVRRVVATADIAAVRQSRRCSHGEPIFRHSSQPSALGATSRMAAAWAHSSDIMISRRWWWARLRRWRGRGRISQTLATRLDRYTAAWPAELPPPTSATSCPAHSRPSKGDAQ